ncbi:Type II secretion system (T2SS)-associated protein Gcp9 [Andalucia godoyi]|uniref:Type II secretion system (T2SS)-associated protein Gcp9 n=1 Tax=Andalucia godoyi TaxID=505711 RepID=A0A8K0AH82_ANDGO|nr:Type II secretion system (T2SS)-associated protein Gcp9 [Andalucia godoyi]|eukprot:ANDGO_06988.mRNA.1 Type II secretion system (T2SS)-associated protein Gcp9
MITNLVSRKVASAQGVISSISASSAGKHEHVPPKLSDFLNAADDGQPISRSYCRQTNSPVNGGSHGEDLRVLGSLSSGVQLNQEGWSKLQDLQSSVLHKGPRAEEDQEMWRLVPKTWTAPYPPRCSSLPYSIESSVLSSLSIAPSTLFVFSKRPKQGLFARAPKKSETRFAFTFRFASLIEVPRILLRFRIVDSEHRPLLEWNQHIDNVLPRQRIEISEPLRFDPHKQTPGVYFVMSSVYLVFPESKEEPILARNNPPSRIVIH